MRESVTSKARRRAAAAPKFRRKSHTYEGVKLLCNSAGEWSTPDGQWHVYEWEEWGWHLIGPGHPKPGTRVGGLRAAALIIRRAQEAEVTA